MLALGAICAAAAASVHAKIYTCLDETGRMILRDVPCKRSEIAQERDTPREPLPTPRASDTKPAARSVQKLSEAQVRELAQSIEAAFLRRDIKPLLTVLAMDAVFEVEYRLPMGVQLVRYNRDDYTGRLRDGFRLGAEYTYQGEGNEVLLAPGETYAEIVGSARQSFWLQNQWQTGVMRSRWSVEMREGRPQITLMRAVVSTSP